MELKLVKKNFADNFLNIIGKTVDVASIKVNKEGLYVILLVKKVHMKIFLT